MSGIRRSPATPVILAAVIGFVVGAAAVGVFALVSGARSATPVAVALGPASLPETVAGTQRDDLTADAHKAGAGQLYRDRISQLAPAVSDAFGGQAVQGTYGVGDGPAFLTVRIVEATQPLPVPASDDYLAAVGFVSAQSWIEVAGSATARCVGAPGPQGVVIRRDSGASQPAAVATAKAEVLAAKDGFVTCVRSDPDRRFSILISGFLKGDNSGVSVADEAVTLARAVDDLWPTFVH